MVIKSFKNQGTADIAFSLDSKESRKVLPRQLHDLARRRLAVLNNAKSLRDLANIRGNRLEILVGNRKGQCSIRINIQYRVCFEWVDGDAWRVEIVDYH